MRDAEVLEVGNLLDQAGEGSRMTHAGRGMSREATDVHLVDDDIGRVARDGEACAPTSSSGCVTIARRLLPVVWPAIDGTTIPARIAHRACPRIEQLCRRIEALVPSRPRARCSTCRAADLRRTRARRRRCDERRASARSPGTALRCRRLRTGAAPRRVASREKMEKLTPSASALAPGGKWFRRW